MAMGSLLAADELCQIICKISIGWPPICRRPQFNGKTTLVSRPIKSVTPVYFFLSLPFFASCWRDLSAHRMDPLVSSTFSSVMGPDLLGTGTKLLGANIFF